MVQHDLVKFEQFGKYHDDISVFAAGKGFVPAMGPLLRCIMARTWLVVGTVLLLTMPAHADLKFENIQLAEGRLGPQRTTLDFFPEEEIVFRYLITGMKLDENGKIAGELTVSATDPRGQVVFTRNVPVPEAVLALGGGTMPGFASVQLSAGSMPGAYTVKVAFEDKHSGQTAMFERRLNLQPAAFAVITPRFFYDPDGKVPAPPGGKLSQTLYVRLKAIGFDRSQEKVDIAMDMQVLDAKGQEVMPKPIHVRLRTSDSKVLQQVTSVDFSGELALNRTGEYTLRITITDEVRKKSTQYQTAIGVTAP
jgi:hypothetical protein